MKSLILSIFLLPSFVFAGEKVIGKVYPISEPDPYDEIAERSAKIDIDSIKDKVLENQTYIKQFRSPALPRTESTSTVLITPSATAPADIYDKNGDILYPRGFKFNPLDYRKMSGRIVIIDQSDIGQIDLLPTDTVIINKGDIKQSSIALGNKPVFILDRFTASTLTHLRSSPTIVSQSGNQLRYYEIEIQ